MARIQKRRERRQTPGRFRLRKPVWNDPYPNIPGTRPEKRILAALVQRGIFFIFQGDFPATDRARYPLLQVTNFKPDFVLPEYRVVFDPFGDFAHTQPDSIERDYLKTIVYEGIGYEFIHPWSSDVERNGGDWVLDLSRNLRAGPRFPLTDPLDKAAKASLGYRLGPYLGLGATSTAAANRLRRKPPSLTLKRGRTRR